MLFLDDEIDEDELLVMFSELHRKNPTFPFWDHARIEVQLDDISEAEFKSEFRFGLAELPLLCDALRIPEKFTCDNGTVASGIEGLLMLLKRFAVRISVSLERHHPQIWEIHTRNESDTGRSYRPFP
ncbi:hypothetical protein QZH41_006838 [Actinostola sp. cb2023]|nr:hypothetical protein QZH41_006838 [Actinostola sp. cb2023]